MAWILLTIAGLIEVAWALALKESAGFTRFVPTAIFLPLYLASAVLLGFALKSLPVGTGYAVWVGIGAIGSALGGVLLFGEGIGLSRLIPISMIAVAVVWLAAVETP